MSLRTRLIIAFLLLSVVLLPAVTLLSYRGSVNAFERAAQQDTTESAADVSRRMELITADVWRRMDRLFVRGTRLQALVEREHLQNIDALLLKVETQVSTFRGNAWPFDEETMMALRVSG